MSKESQTTMFEHIIVHGRIYRMYPLELIKDPKKNEQMELFRKPSQKQNKARSRPRKHKIDAS